MLTTMKIMIIMMTEIMILTMITRMFIMITVIINIQSTTIHQFWREARIGFVERALQTDSHFIITLLTYSCILCVCVCFTADHKDRCVDTVTKMKCRLIVNFNLCGHRMFSKRCCLSCRQAGKILRNRK